MMLCYVLLYERVIFTVIVIVAVCCPSKVLDITCAGVQRVSQQCAVLGQLLWSQWGAAAAHGAGGIVGVI